MGNMKFIESIVDDKLLDLNTAYIGKVVSTTGSTATVQPLSRIKEYGNGAKKKSSVFEVPIISSARNKITTQTVVIEGKSYQLAKLTPISTGDIVICVCCDRDISQSIKGQYSTPQIGHHSINDSVIIGIL